VVAISGSVALLGDTLHNAADALTAVPQGVAFLVGRRPPTRRYTYGYGRAEDLAGIVIVVSSRRPQRWPPMRRSPGSPIRGRCRT
jgi:divalent metal cation (Fe/Co/Zn/Cd) transporter